MKNRIKLCSEQKYLALILDLYTVTTHCHNYTTKRSVSARLGQRGRRGASTNDVTGGNNSYALIGEPRGMELKLSHGTFNDLLLNVFHTYLESKTISS